jgi:hypothetical protein
LDALRVMLSPDLATMLVAVPTLFHLRFILNRRS